MLASALVHYAVASCLELALNGKLDIETRQNLSQSHAASKVRVFVFSCLLRRSLIAVMTTRRVCSSPSTIFLYVGLVVHFRLYYSFRDPFQDLTKLESGNETMFNEPFDLQSIIMEATNLYKYEAERKGLDFELDLSSSPRMVVGDSSKIKTVVANLTANARKRLLTPQPPFFSRLSDAWIMSCQ